MVNTANHYRDSAKQCCLNAVVADDISRSTHWLEAAARWLEFGQQAGAVLSANGPASGLQLPGSKRSPAEGHPRG